MRLFVFLCLCASLGAQLTTNSTTPDNSTNSTQVCNCPATHLSVCGADGKTYASACLAAYANVTVAQHHECVDCTRHSTYNYTPVCGHDGITYKNIHQLICLHQQELNHFGSCPAQTDCTCSLYSHYVCGVDGKLYTNNCFARCANVATEDLFHCITIHVVSPVSWGLGEALPILINDTHTANTTNTTTNTGANGYYYDNATGAQVYWWNSTYTINGTLPIGGNISGWFFDLTSNHWVFVYNGQITNSTQYVNSSSPYGWHWDNHTHTWTFSGYSNLDQYPSYPIGWYFDSIKGHWINVDATNNPTNGWWYNSTNGMWYFQGSESTSNSTMHFNGWWYNSTTGTWSYNDTNVQNNPPSEGWTWNNSTGQWVYNGTDNSTYNNSQTYNTTDGYYYFDPASGQWLFYSFTDNQNATETNSTNNDSTNGTADNQTNPESPNPVTDGYYSWNGPNMTWIYSTSNSDNNSSLWLTSANATGWYFDNESQNWVFWDTEKATQGSMWWSSYYYYDSTGNSTDPSTPVIVVNNTGDSTVIIDNSTAPDVAVDNSTDSTVPATDEVTPVDPVEPVNNGEVVVTDPTVTETPTDTTVDTPVDNNDPVVINNESTENNQTVEPTEPAVTA